MTLLCVFCNEIAQNGYLELYPKGHMMVTMTQKAGSLGKIAALSLANKAWTSMPSVPNTGFAWKVSLYIKQRVQVRALMQAHDTRQLTKQPPRV